MGNSLSPFHIEVVLFLFVRTQTSSTERAGGEGTVPTEGQIFYLEWLLSLPTVVNQ